jgi:carboxyl-terminal processing protease
VIAPLDDTPAAHAGLLANDLSTRIDGEDIVGSLKEATEKMRGKVNTPVTLTIVRPGHQEPFDVKLSRAVIRIKPVKAHAEGDIGICGLVLYQQTKMSSTHNDPARRRAVPISG